MAGVWMAKEIGAFERHGINAELVYISSGAVVVQALVGGSLHAALGASNAVIAAILKGAPIIAVGSNTSRPGMQLWVHPDIQRPEQLAGKTLGDYPVRLDQRVRHALGAAQAQSRRQNRTTPVRRRQSKPILAIARPIGGTVVVAIARPRCAQAGRRRGLGIPFSMNLLAVSIDFYRKSPKTVEGIIAAYIEGIAALKQRKQQASNVLAKYMGQRGGSAEFITNSS